MQAQHQIDRQKVEEFGGKLIEILNHGALNVMLSIGHRTGLFDTMSQLPPSTSEQIAKAAGLSERYVREWLGAMATGGVVECHPNGSSPSFSLPPEHAASLTRAAGANNIAPFTQYLAVMGSVEDRIVECFKNGGGVSYEEYKRFHEVMAEDSGQTVGSSLTETILPLVNGLTAALQRGIEVLDIGCGRGHALNLMAKAFPQSRFTGYDLSNEAIAYARAAAAENALQNLRFEVKDLTAFDEEAPKQGYDLITAFDAIHDQARPDRVLAGIYKALKPDGIFLMQDIAGSSYVHNNLDHPMAPLFYATSTMHCMPVSLAQGGMGLGTMWGKEKATEMLREAGFTQIDVRQLPHDFQNYYYLVSKTPKIETTGTRREMSK